MLYVTTRERFDAFTAPRTLQSDVAKDGGVYVPFKIPKWENEGLNFLLSGSFGEVTAAILNQFFSCGLTGWDVEAAVGRIPVKAETVGNKIFSIQLYQNLGGSYEALEQTFCRMVCKDCTNETRITSWLKIAVRISVLFASFAQLNKKEIPLEQGLDLCLGAEDFSIAVASWLARKMGLPIHTVILGCDEGSPVWDFLRYAQVKTDADAGFLQEAERFLYLNLGLEEALRFGTCVDQKGLYQLSQEQAEELKSGLFCSVVSADRANQVLSGVFRTNAYSLSPDAGAAYGALMDYRAKSGSNHPALVLEHSAPKSSK